MESKYHIIKYSAKAKSERGRQHWNDVTDDPLGEYWLGIREAFETDDYYYDPVLDNAIRITEEDFNKLNGVLG